MDTIALAAAVLGFAAAAPPSSWQFETRQARPNAPITQVVWGNALPPKQDCLFCSRPVVPQLAIVCHEGKTSLFFGGLPRVMARPGMAVTLRLDHGEAVAQKGWEAADDGTYVTLPAGRRPVATAKHLVSAQHLVVRVDDQEAGPTEASFDLADLGRVIAPLREQCRW
jgi:type VI secretion system VasI family protein